MKEIYDIFIDIKVRTSKLENMLYQSILEEIKERKDELERSLIKEIKLDIKNKKLTQEEIKQGLKGLMNKGIDIIYHSREEKIEISFNYISSYKKVGEEFFICVPLNVINCFKKNTLEYNISLRTFFYLRKRAIITFFNILIKNIEQIKTIELTLEELKKIFEISDEAYERFFDFDKNILKPLIEKINNYSNLTVEYEKIKKGENKNNKIIGIKFKVNNIELEKNRGETNYLIQIIKNMITDYEDIWKSINESIQHYGFESTKRNILFLKENGLEISDNDIKNYLRNDGRNIEEILKISDHILIKEKYSICKDVNTFVKLIYDSIIGYDFYYSLNFKFLNVIKNYKENENFYYKDSTFVVFGNYKKNKGFFKIFEAREKV